MQEYSFSEEQLHPELLTNFEKQFEIQFPLFTPDFNSEEYKLAAKKVRDFYFNGKMINFNGLNDLMSDIHYLYGVYISARFQAAKSTGRTYFAR